MLYLKAAAFLILIPGIVAVVLPWVVLRVSGHSLSPAGGGALLFAVAGLSIGCLIYLSCVWHFANRGLGTLSPTSPPRRLVVTGVYRYVRNPMYICAVIVLSSEAVLFRSAWLGLYTVLATAAYAAFVVFYEEPDLRRRFGQSYEDYAVAVPRWTPRLPGLERKR